MHYPIRVLFLCTGNSARSQMAEALLRSFGREDFEVFSAGTDPGTLHPLAVQVMQELGIDISGQHSKHLDEFLERDFDYVITVCDRARDKCPTFPGDNQRIHWSYDDPAAVQGEPADRLQAFRRTLGEMSERIRVWVTVQRKLLKNEGAAAGADAS